MDPTLKSAVETAVAVLSRSRGGPDGAVAAAAAIESVRRALEDTQAASIALRPRAPLESIPELLLTQRPYAAGGGGPLPSLTGSAMSGSGASAATPTARSTAAVASVVREAAFAYDRAAAAMLERIDRA